jgi:hypothetical protein
VFIYFILKFIGNFINEYSYFLFTIIEDQLQFVISKIVIKKTLKIDSRVIKNNEK